MKKNKVLSLKWIAVIAGLFMMPSLAVAEYHTPISEQSPNTPANLIDYCKQAQKVIASTEMMVSNYDYSDYKAYVKSKPAVDPLTTQQYVYYDTVGGIENFPLIISCKLKSSDRIRDIYGEDKAGEEKSCRVMIETMLEETLANLGDTPLRYPRGKVKVVDDDVVRAGPQWLKPWPFNNAYLDPEDNLILQAKALYVPYSKLIPMPARFKGTHYCHLPTPQYLEKVLVGKVTPPTDQ